MPVIRIGKTSIVIETPQQAQQAIDQYEDRMSGGTLKALEDFADSNGDESDFEDLENQLED